MATNGYLSYGEWWTTWTGGEPLPSLSKHLPARERSLSRLLLLEFPDKGRPGKEWPSVDCPPLHRQSYLSWVSEMVLHWWLYEGSMFGVQIIEFGEGGQSDWCRGLLWSKSPPEKAAILESLSYIMWTVRYIWLIFPHCHIPFAMHLQKWYMEKIKKQIKQCTFVISSQRKWVNGSELTKI